MADNGIRTVNVPVGVPTEILGHADDGTGAFRLVRGKLADLASTIRDLVASDPSGIAGVRQDLAALANTLSSSTAALTSAQVKASARAVVALMGRPGDLREGFTRSTAGGPAEDLPVFDGLIALSPRGYVFQAVGADQVVSRRYVAFEPGRRYQARGAFIRASDAADPSNDTVRVVVFWYDQALNPLTGGNAFSLVEDVNDLLVASGRREVKRLAATAAGDGIDIVAPPGAVFGRIGLITFGGAQRTQVEVLDLVDVSDSTLVSADVSGALSRIAAQESINAGGRLPPLEAALNAPAAISYATRLDAQNASITGTVRSLLLRGVAALGKGSGEWVRASAPASMPVKFTTADGAVWEPSERIVITPEQAGAVGDGVTNDFAALDAVRQFAENFGCHVRLARNYYTATAVDWRNVVLDPTPAAVLSGNVDVSRFGRLLADLALNVNTGGVNFFTVASSRDRPTGLRKSIWASGGAAARAARSYKAVDCTGLIRQQVAFPAGDGWTDTPGTLGTSPAAGQAAVTGDQIAWNITSGGIWYGGFTPIHGGQCLQGHFATAGNYVRAAFVRTSLGYACIYGNATGQLTLAIKRTGQTLTSRVLGAYVGLANAQAYQPGVSRWEIEVESFRYWRVKLNGQDVSGRLDIGDGDEIEMAGFGCLASADAVVPAVDFWTLIDTTEATGRAPVDIAIFGDSQAYTRTGSIENVLREVLDGANGLRVGNITNRAVPGTNTIDAYNALVANGIGAARYVVLMSMVNDQQGGSPVSGSRGNVGNFIDGARANGGIPIIVVEPRFYNRAEGNPNGFATVNAASQVDYRGGITNVAAARGAIVIDLNEVLGPIIPGGVLGAFAMDEDNIHLTPYGKRLAGKAIADAILAFESRPLTAAIAEKQLPSRFANGWSGTTQYPTYSVTSDGTTRRLHLGGLIDVGTTADATLVYALPRNLWPKTTRTPVVGVNGAAGTAKLRFNPLDGAVRIFSLPAGATSICLDGLSFEIAG